MKNIFTACLPLFFLAFLLASCEQPTNTYEGESLRTGRVTFFNESSYRVNVRLGNFQGVTVIENLPSGETRTVDIRVSDHALGTVFAVEYLWMISADFDPDSGEVFASGFDPSVQPSHVIEEGRPITIQIPQPANIEFRSSFITLFNTHHLPIDLRHFGSLLRQDGNGLFPIAPGRTGIYRLDPIPLGGERTFTGFNISGLTPVPEFTALNGYIYAFNFNGNSVTLTEARPLIVR